MKEKIEVDRKKLRDEILHAMTIGHHYRTTIADEDSIVLLQILKDLSVELDLGIEKRIRKYYQWVDEKKPPARR